MIHTDLPATLPPNSDKLFRGYSYLLPSVLCSEYVMSDELFQPTAGTPPNSADLYIANILVGLSTWKQN
jgi:ribosomal protein S6 kinase alpha-5